MTKLMWDTHTPDAQKVTSSSSFTLSLGLNSHKVGFLAECSLLLTVWDSWILCAREETEGK